MIIKRLIDATGRHGFVTPYLCSRCSAGPVRESAEAGPDPHATSQTYLVQILDILWTNLLPRFGGRMRKISAYYISFAIFGP
jgi:hypothetical protein